MRTLLKLVTEGWPRSATPTITYRESRSNVAAQSSAQLRENFRKGQITPVKTHKLCNGPVFAKAPLASPSLSKILVTRVTSHSIKEIHHADTKNDASRGG